MNVQNIMNAWFSDRLPLMSVVFEYLTAKDVASWRKSGRQSALNTFHYAPNWQKYVQANWNVCKCGICDSIRGFHKTEWCALCENRVCVDHLDHCRVCNDIFCYECAYSCCG